MIVEPIPQQFSVNGEGLAYCIDASYRNGLAPSGVGKGKRTHIIETEEIKIDNTISEQKVYGKKAFTYGSAFAGIGGMTLGLKPLGGEGVIAWEFDPTEKRTQYAQEAHKLLHPEIPVHGDICKANTDEIPYFDVFCFTPPCQAFSVAGKRGGFDDTRGTLTFEALRIANAKKPKILFMENVKGLIGHDKGNTMSTIIHAINEIGFTVDFTVLNSKYFDVAQNRERVYLIALRDDLITPEPWEDIKGTAVLQKAKRRYQEEGARTFNFDWPEQTEVRTKLRDFLDVGVDERYYLSKDKTVALVAQLERSLIIPSILDTRQKSADTKGGKSGVRVSSNVCPTISASEIKDVKKVIEENREEAFTITALDRHDVAIGEYPKYRIRKLTPAECLKLQSVPQWAIDVILNHFSDSRAYKFAGNGLTTNVITSIGEKLLKYL